MKAFLAVALMLVSTSAMADGLSAIKCGSIIPRTLRGVNIPNDPAQQIESRYREINLHFLGSTQYDSRLSLISISICGKEYLLLHHDKNNVVMDAIELEHSRKRPVFFGYAEYDVKHTSEAVIAVLNNDEGWRKEYDPKDQSLRPVLSAWFINERSSTFIKAHDVNGWFGSRTGVFTVDGGP